VFIVKCVKTTIVSCIFFLLSFFRTHKYTSILPPCQYQCTPPVPRLLYTEEVPYSYPAVTGGGDDLLLIRTPGEVLHCLTVDVASGD
jgi:hypothetical protein